MKSPEESALASRAVAGDRVALATLWARDRRLVAAVLLAHAPPGEVEDLLQEVAVKVVKRIGELRDPAAWRGWVRRIAVHEAGRLGRRNLLRRTRDLDAASEFADPKAVRGIELLELREEADQVLRVILGLAPELREPLLLRLDGRPVAEVADVLELTEAATATRLARGRAAVRERLVERAGSRRDQRTRDQRASDQESGDASTRTAGRERAARS